jgi:hypothetical protein
MPSAKERRYGPAGPRALRPGVEYEFDQLTLPRDLSRNFVTRLLTERAEREGWELARVRVTADGTRRIVLRRKIIRQRPMIFVPI